MSYADQPSRIKSVRLASTPELTSPLELRWVWRSGKRTGSWLGFAPSGVVVGSEGQLHGLDLETGQVRWCLDGLQPIGLCGEVLLAHELGPSNFVVHAFETDGRRLWQVSTSRQVNTDYCAGRDGFYAWPRYPTPSGTRLTADFHPLGEPERPSEVEGPPNYYIAELREHAGWVASYRWGEGPSQCAVYRGRINASRFLATMP